MSKKTKVHLFVDNSNVLLEGRRQSQQKKKNAPRLSKFLDDSYHVDWGKFLYLVLDKDQRGLANLPILYGSRPPPDDSVWERIRNDGFDAKVFDRNIRNKEKGVDMEMGMDIAELINSGTAPGTILMAAGDADYLPAIRRAQSKGWTVEAWFWGNAAQDVKKTANRFGLLDPHLEFLRFGGGAI